MNSLRWKARTTVSRLTEFGARMAVVMRQAIGKRVQSSSQRWLKTVFQRSVSFNGRIQATVARFADVEVAVKREVKVGEEE